MAGSSNIPGFFRPRFHRGNIVPIVGSLWDWHQRFGRCPSSSAPRIWREIARPPSRGRSAACNHDVAGRRPPLICADELESVALVAVFWPLSAQCRGGCRPISNQELSAWPTCPRHSARAGGCASVVAQKKRQGSVVVASIPPGRASPTERVPDQTLAHTYLGEESHDTQLSSVARIAGLFGGFALYGHPNRGRFLLSPQHLPPGNQPTVPGLDGVGPNTPASRSRILFLVQCRLPDNVLSDASTRPAGKYSGSPEKIFKLLRAFNTPAGT